jgi:hypothetical protein
LHPVNERITVNKRRTGLFMLNGLGVLTNKYRDKFI